MTGTPQWTERFVLLYFSGDEGRARVPEVFPAHHAYTASFRAQRPDQLLLTGPFADSSPGQPGAMNVFATREAAEEFAADDPFVTEGVVASWSVRTWLTGED
ncbi:YciI family protein [Sinomonas sp. G460-2]|uniref:YciI family protein n=1 Tax=Sinomonas sp. G460-2 TaxID=3393464 RepID=UPI0039F0ED33